VASGAPPTSQAWLYGALVLRRVAVRDGSPGAAARPLRSARCTAWCPRARSGSQVELPPLRPAALPQPDTLFMRAPWVAGGSAAAAVQTLPTDPTLLLSGSRARPGWQVELPPLRPSERLRAGDSLLLMPGQAAALAPAPPGVAGRAAPGADGYWAGDAPQYVTLTLLLPTADSAASPGARPALTGAAGVQPSPCLRAVESGGWRLPIQYLCG